MLAYDLSRKWGAHGGTPLQIKLRIGATEEGVLRSYVISEHKGLRDLVVFSIISSEWPHVKTKLEALLSKYDDR